MAGTCRTFIWGVLLMGNRTRTRSRQKPAGQANKINARKIIGWVTKVEGQVWLLDWDVYEGSARVIVQAGMTVLAGYAFDIDKHSEIEVHLNSGVDVLCGPDSLLQFT